jgi:hypothetical protein
MFEFYTSQVYGKCDMSRHEDEQIIICPLPIQQFKKIYQKIIRQEYCDNNIMHPIPATRPPRYIPYTEQRHVTLHP